MEYVGQRLLNGERTVEWTPFTGAVDHSHHILKRQTSSESSPSTSIRFTNDGILRLNSNSHHSVSQRMDLRSRYSRDLNEVLENGAALDAFREWIALDENRTSEGLSLHFALKGLKKYLSDREPNVNKIACQLHRKFISVHTGSCSFLPESVRREMSNRIHSLSSENPVTISLFEPVEEPVRRHLAVYHAQFVCSQPFYKLINNSQTADESAPLPSTSFSLTPSRPQYSVTNGNMFATMGPPISIDLPPPVPRHANDGNNSLNWCEPSTSRAFPMDGSFATEDRTLGYRTQRRPEPVVDALTIRHDRHEARVKFAALIAEKLEKIARNLERHSTFSGEECFARDLPKECESPLMPSVDTLPPEETTSDEEIAKYVGKTIDSERRRRSASASPDLSAVRGCRQSSDEQPSSDPYGVNGFAPPPSKHRNRYDFNRVVIPNHLTSSTSRANRSIDYLMSDSSGFCSAESAFCDRSFDRIQPVHLDCSSYSSQPPTLNLSGSLMRGNRHRVEGQYTPNGPAFSTIPRPRYTTSSHITVTVREEGKPPMVAKIPNKEITLKQFRRTFGISSRDHKRFQFKSACEDDSAPFQWSIINDDTDTVPVFEGKITAECKYYYEDSD